MKMARRPSRMKYWLLSAAITSVALLVAPGALAPGAEAQPKDGTHVTLSAGAGAPGASGRAIVGLVGGVMVGTVHVSNLPAQPFGSGRFYGLWYVRGDDSKAFLGALIRKDSIIFSTGGNGSMRFSGTKFTTGPAVGAPIVFGPPGTNTLILLIENIINGLTPAPVGPVPGTGVAVVGTF